MERTRQQWRGKMTLYRSVQSQPDLVTKPVVSSEKSQLTLRPAQQMNFYVKNRPHTAEARARFQEPNPIGANITTRPNTATTSSKNRSVSSITPASSFKLINYISSELPVEGYKGQGNFGKEDIVKKVRAQSCRRRSARLSPEERKKIVLAHRQTSEEKVQTYYRLLKEKRALEKNQATQRALAAKRFSEAIWKVLWVIRWKRAMIAISLDKMVMTAMEMDWHTRNTDTMDKQFRREDYSRSKELALLKNGTRAATITCREDCELLTVDNAIFSVICPSIFEEELQEKLAFIRCLPIFMSGMWSEENLYALCADGQIKQYKNSKVVVADNALEDWLYICMEGKCKVIRCMTVQTELNQDGQLTSRSCKDEEKSAHLFSSIINEGGDNAQRWFSSTDSPLSDAGTSAESRAIFQKVQMLNSMALDWIWAREQVEEVRRRSKNETKDQSLRISGVKNFTTLMKELRAKAHKNREEIVFIEIAEVHPKDIFDIHAILRSGTDEGSKNSHLILVSAGAKMVRLKQTEFLKRATFEALEYIKTITETERYPTENELLKKYLVTHSWQRYKERAISSTLNNKGIESESAFNKLYAERLNTSTKLLQTLRLNELVECEFGPEEEDKEREPFQFELDRIHQGKESAEQRCILQAQPSSQSQCPKRRASAIGTLPNLVEHLLLETTSSSPSVIKIK
ncbi:uncharacterized protein [Watersipora subatra]|uniref:uncharacterized protein n=1 Tax=Watersipora subatra TaxID=2589382 RepID=UPI00355B8B9B